jgi:hypothetical protein
MARPLSEPVTLTETILRALSVYEELRDRLPPREARERTIALVAEELSRPGVRVCGLLAAPGDPRWFHEFLKR